MHWQEFTLECPELAELAAARFARDQVLLLGTLRPDGSPRISAVECDFAVGELLTGMIHRSVKALDLRRDPRVTKIGSFLRRSSLDELPQLFNVLSGAMSMVGPRPPLPSEVVAYDDDVRRRLLVKPGMTGLWQVSGRSELSWAESVRLDLHYVDNWSPALDVRILARTVTAVIRGTGAY